MEMNRKRTRREVLGLLSIASLSQGAATPERPNILFIYTDDHSYRTLSCYPEAYPWVRTPNIDKLAKQGVRFARSLQRRLVHAVARGDAHRTSSVRRRIDADGRSISRAARTIPQKCPFWPKVFRAKGYFTAQIGKWHTGTDTGYGRDWDYQLVWNRPKYTETSTHYYYDQPITYQGGKTEVLKRYSTDQYTDWADGFHSRQRPRQGEALVSLALLRRCPWSLHSSRAAQRRTEGHRLRHAGRHLSAARGQTRLGAERSSIGRKARMARRWLEDRTLTSWVRQYHQGVFALDEAVGPLDGDSGDRPDSERTRSSSSLPIRAWRSASMASEARRSRLTMRISGRL